MQKCNGFVLNLDFFLNTYNEKLSLLYKAVREVTPRSILLCIEHLQSILYLEIGYN